MEQNGSAVESSAPADSGTQPAILDSQMDNGQDTSIEGKGARFEDFEAMDEARETYVKAKTAKDETREQKAPTPVKGKEEKTKLLKDLEQESDEKSREALEDPARQKVKPYKAMIGDKAVDLDPTTKLKIPVDGQKADVTIRELVDNYNGKVAYDKRFNELDVQKKRHAQDKQVFDNQSRVFRTFSDLATQDPTKAIMFALDTANVDPHDFINKFRESTMGDIEALADMLPEERRTHFLQKENELLKERSRTNLERAKETQALKQVEARIEQVRQSKGVSEDEFSKAYQELVKLGTQKPSIELVAETAIDIRAIGKTNNILGAIHPKLISNKDVFEETWKHVREGEFTDNEIAQLVRESLGLKATAALKKAPVNPSALRAQSKTTSDSDYENGFFSDYDD